MCYRIMFAASVGTTWVTKACESPFGYHSYYHMILRSSTTLIMNDADLSAPLPPYQFMLSRLTKHGLMAPHRTGEPWIDRFSPYTYTRRLL